MSALYGTAVGLHVVLVLAGTIGLAVTVGYLAAGHRAADRLSDPGSALRRFFSAGPSLAPRLLYPAAALGLAAALSSSDRVRLQWAWVWGAGALWLGAAVLIEAGLRPAERQLAALLTAAPDAAAPFLTRPVARRGLVAAVGALAMVLASSALMTAQP